MRASTKSKCSRCYCRKTVQPKRKTKTAFKQRGVVIDKVKTLL